MGNIKAPTGYKFEKVSETEVQLVPLIDFSILNKEDWFTIFVEDQVWMNKGGNLFDTNNEEYIRYCLGNNFCLSSKKNENIPLCEKSEVIKLRKSTTEEINDFYKMFPKLKPQKS